MMYGFSFLVGIQRVCLLDSTSFAFSHKSGLAEFDVVREEATGVAGLGYRCRDGSDYGGSSPSVQQGFGEAWSCDSSRKVKCNRPMACPCLCLDCSSVVAPRQLRRIMMEWIVSVMCIV